MFVSYKMDKRLLVITQTAAIHICFSCCLLFLPARIYRPLPGLKSSLKDFFGFFSPGVCITPHRTLTSGRISPATFIGCDGSRFLIPLQRSACDYAEVSLLLSYVLASPYIPYGFCGYGFTRMDRQFHMWLSTTGT